MSNTVVVIDMTKQKSFRYGQVYVALSRTKSFSVLTIVGTLKKNFSKLIQI